MKSLGKFMVAMGVLFLVMVVHANGPHSQQDTRCLDCHSERLNGQTLHFAQNNDDCMFCHGGIDGAAVISTETDNLVCVACHADHDIDRHTDAHTDLLCTDCHDPHSSAEPHLFRLPEGSLCANECHGEHDLGMSHPTGAGTLDKTTGSEVTCISTCHTMHQPHDEKMLQMASTDLCFQCHDDKF